MGASDGVMPACWLVSPSSSPHNPPKPSDPQQAHNKKRHRAQDRPQADMKHSCTTVFGSYRAINSLLCLLWCARYGNHFGVIVQHSLLAYSLRHEHPTLPPTLPVPLGAFLPCRFVTNTLVRKTIKKGSIRLSYLPSYIYRRKASSRRK